MTEQQLQADIANIQQIPIVEKMLEVICRTTGMGFAAIARVTEERWIACSVRDEIDFGLKPGGELKVKTTICDEIRATGNGIVIDQVAVDPHFCTHPTPAMYGFQSYISLPIMRRNGDFFGTLCAIDPQPQVINNARVTGMFSLFAELISFHLESIELMEKNLEMLQSTNTLLSAATEENKQYAHLTHHSLIEPARKIALFCDILVRETIDNDPQQAKVTAERLKILSLELIDRIRPLRAMDVLL